MKNDKTYKTWLDKTKPVTFTMVNFDFDYALTCHPALLLPPLHLQNMEKHGKPAKGGKKLQNQRKSIDKINFSARTTTKTLMEF